MNTLKEFISINEGFSPYFKLIYDDFIIYLKNEYNIKKPVKLKVQPKRKVAVGDVNMSEMMNGKFVISTKSDRGVSVTLINIAHEMTHINQFLNNKLSSVQTEDGTFITWNGKPIISDKDYDSITYAKYKELPWEKEAIMQGLLLFKQYEKSGSVESLIGKNKTLDYLIANDLVFV